MAKGDIRGKVGLYAGEAFATGGAVCLVESDATGCNFHPIEYSGGACEKLNQGVLAVSLHSQRKQG